MAIKMVPSPRNINPRKPKASLFTLQSLLTHGVCGTVCFYLGVLVGLSDIGGQPKLQPVSTPCPPCPPPSIPVDTTTGNVRVDQVQAASTSDRTFPATLSNMFVDFATVDRVELNNVLNVGVPLDDTKTGAEHALILYTSSRTLPSTKSATLNASQAVENCRTVKLILMNTAQQHPVPECLAILPQWESYHVHKFMRLPNKGPLDPAVPLRYVSRSHDNRGYFSPTPSYRFHTKPFYDALAEYLKNLNQLLDEIKPLVESLLQASTNPQSKTIVVQVCNYGQVELFANYLCNAKAKGLDFSHIFLFATDIKTYQLCQAMGIPSYYNEAIFGDMPEMAARGYGDKIFSKMMMAKVYCVHLVLSLGYNVLFQDVDMVWYQNPLPYLESPDLKEWDLIFQDDGARSHRYAPFSPNTGFYFVRYNENTLFFFGMLLRSGDVVAKTTSHQTALTALLNEHVSWKGLRVKVFRRGENNPFPGGVEYHRFKDLMKRILLWNLRALNQRLEKPIPPPVPEKEELANGETALQVQPYIFHMSWTKNKDNKKLYFQQMGEWYLKESCLTGWDCCLPDPDIVCHYRDKPSLISCKDSPPIDAGRPSFWE